MLLRTIESKEDILQIVDDVGFLPFFKNEIEGFSVEENCAEYLWFNSEIDGPWEWKGPIARTRECMYGKFFEGKAGFISKKWIAKFANFRRDGYDFDSRRDEGIAPFKDEVVFDGISKEGSIISRQLKRSCASAGIKGFDTVITRLQMQTYVCIDDFVYERDKNGNPYGWGIARYTTPEAIFGELARAAYKEKPMKSAQDIFEHLNGLNITRDENKLLRLLGIKR